MRRRARLVAGLGWLGAALTACGPAQQPTSSPPVRPATTVTATSEPAPAEPPPAEPAPAEPSPAEPAAPEPSAPEPVASLLPPLRTMSHDAAGKALAEGTLRRFGGARFRADRHHQLVFSPGGDLTVVKHGFSRFAGKPPHLTLADAVTGAQLFQKTSNASWWSSPALSHDLRLLVEGDKEAVVWDIRSGKQLGKRSGLARPYGFVAGSVLGRRRKQLVLWNPKTGASRTLATVTGSIAQLQAAGNMVALIESRPDKKKKHRSHSHLWLIDAKTGKKRSFSLPAGFGSYDLVLSLDKAGGFALAVGGTGIKRADLSSPDLTPLLTLPKKDHPRHLSKMLLSVVDTVAAATFGERLTLFHPASGTVIRELVSDATIRSLAVSYDGTMVAILTELGEVRRFRIANGEELAAPIGQSWVGPAVLDRASRNVVTAGRRVDVWDVASGNHLRTKQAATRITQAEMVSDEALVTLDFAGDIKRWSLKSLDSVVLAGDAKKGVHGGNRSMFRGARGADVSHLAVDARAARIAYSKVDKEGDDYGETLVTRVIDADGKLQFDLPQTSQGPTALAFGPNGRLAVAQDGSISIYDKKGHAVARRHAHQRRDNVEGVSALAFSPNAKWLAIATSARLEVWDIARDELIRGLAGRFTAVAFLDADHVMVGDDNGTLTTLSLHGPARRRRPLLPDAVTTLSASPRGVLVSSESGTPVLLSRSWLVPAASGSAAGSPAAAAAAPPREVAVVVNAQRIGLFENARGGPTGCVSVAGAVSCWGANDDGMLGFGDDKPRKAAESIGATVDGFGIGGRRGCGWKGSRVTCWGHVGEQGGDKWSNNGKTPVELTQLAALRVRQMSLSSRSLCALRHDRTVACHWGRRNRRRDERAVFQTIAALRGVTTLDSSDEHGCGIDGEGQVWCWGDNSEGQLGYGQASAEAPAHAVRVLGLSGARQVAVGDKHSCALKKSGELWCWGAGRDGQMGDGRSVARHRPIKVPGLRDVRAIALGGNASCAIAGQGSVHCWGRVEGLRAAEPLLTLPQAVIGLSSAKAIETTGRRSCAITAGGKIMCWGQPD